MNKKTKALITSIILSAMAGGGFKFGLPATQKLIDKLNKIEARQEEYIINQETDLRLRFDKPFIDSVKNEIRMEKYMHERGH